MRFVNSDWWVYVQKNDDAEMRECVRTVTPAVRLGLVPTHLYNYQGLLRSASSAMCHTCVVPIFRLTICVRNGPRLPCPVFVEGCHNAKQPAIIREQPTTLPSRVRGAGKDGFQRMAN